MSVSVAEHRSTGFNPPKLLSSGQAGILAPQPAKANRVGQWRRHGLAEIVG